MLELAPAAGFAIFFWWFSTGAILYVDGLSPRTFPRSLAVASALAGAALSTVWWTAHDASVFGAYTAFVAALVLWGWHELSLLTGFVTGPNQSPCPPDARGWRRFRLATGTIIHHEVALALTMAAVALLTWGGSNYVAPATFFVLWIMRISAKLNIFLGVSGLSEEFIPPHLAYLPSYFRRAPMNPLMPLSVLGSTAGVVALGLVAVRSVPSSFPSVAATLVGTMLALALLEHLFLVLPVADSWLWRWALRSHARRRALAAAD